MKQSEEKLKSATDANVFSPSACVLLPLTNLLRGKDTEK